MHIAKIFLNAKYVWRNLGIEQGPWIVRKAVKEEMIDDCLFSLIAQFRYADYYLGKSYYNLNRYNSEKIILNTQESLILIIINDRKQSRRAHKEGRTKQAQPHAQGKTGEAA